MRQMAKMLIVMSFLITQSVYAAGMTQHIFMADIAWELLQPMKLRQLLNYYDDAYMVGAVYPDSGYPISSEYAELSHSTDFIDAFVNYINDKSKRPYDDCPRLVSFMLGAASHVADDPPYHQLFIVRVAEEDFNGDYSTAHTYCDTGIDFLSIIDYDRWLAHPEWWVPVQDLLCVYQRMGYHFNPNEIIIGNAVMKVASFGERLAAPLVYNKIRTDMPWGSANYYDYPEGGLFNCGEIVADYWIELWERIISGRSGFSFGSIPMLSGHLKIKPSHRFAHLNPAFEFGYQCLAQGCVQVDLEVDDAGWILIGEPRIINVGLFNTLLNRMIDELAAN